MVTQRFNFFEIAKKYEQKSLDATNIRESPMYSTVLRFLFESFSQIDDLEKGFICQKPLVFSAVVFGAVYFFLK